MSFEILGNIVKIKGGKRLPKGESLQSSPNKHPYIRIRDMEARYLPRTGLEFVPEKVFAQIKNYIVNTNDVIISIVGSIGFISIIDEYFDNASQTENCAKLSGLDNIDAHYLYYSLISPYGQQQIAAGTVGAVQPKLPLYNIEKLLIYWPARAKREQLVKILKSLDDKIAKNNKINQTLEAMAQALFKSWFVDFDPVKAKMEARTKGGNDDEVRLAAMTVISGKSAEELVAFQASNPEAYAELAATADLFPEALVDSELGPIPEGWEVKRLGELLDLSYGKALPKEHRVDGDYPVYGSGGLTGTHNNPLVQGPGIIVGRKGTVGSLYWETSNFYPIDTVFYVEAKFDIPLTYLYYLLQTLGLQNMNTDAAVPGLNRNNVYRLEIIKSTSSVLAAFAKEVDLFRKKIEILDIETKQLIQTRDTLLPKLLSGEIDLSVFEPEEIDA